MELGPLDTIEAVDGLRWGLVKATARSLLEENENGLSRMQRKAEVMQDATRIESRTTIVTVKPGVVMQMRPSSRAGKIIVESLVEFWLPMGKVRSPGDTTRMMRFMPTSSFSSGSPASRVRRIRRSSRLRLANTCCSRDCGGGGGGPYCWCSGPPDRWCTSRIPGSVHCSGHW
uniref:(northern house mosquito) hypothetical protein n=1 Tax=Culex pipiens TaxID=7175 RepID=A0A8D8FI80_CULPI